jgi:hypothetical protein
LKPIPRASVVTRTATALASACSALLLSSCATAPATLVPVVASRKAPQPVPDPVTAMPDTLSDPLAHGTGFTLPPDGA